MPYKDPEVRRAKHRETDKKRREATAASIADYKKSVQDTSLGRLQNQLRVARYRLRHDQTEEYRDIVDELQDKVDELTAGREIEKLKAVDPAMRNAGETRVELPPLRGHAPEIPPEPAAEKPITQWLAERYWTPQRRSWYGGRLVAYRGRGPYRPRLEADVIDKIEAAAANLYKPGDIAYPQDIADVVGIARCNVRYYMVKLSALGRWPYAWAGSGHGRRKAAMA